MAWIFLVIFSNHHDGLTPVSFNHVKSFNHDDKKVSDVGLTRWCHLSNIMSDSIFHKGVRQEITCFVLFFVYFCLCLFLVCFFYRVTKWWNQFYRCNITGHEEILNYYRLRQKGLISLQRDLKSEICHKI